MGQEPSKLSQSRPTSLRLFPSTSNSGGVSISKKSHSRGGEFGSSRWTIAQSMENLSAKLFKSGSRSTLFQRKSSRTKSGVESGQQPQKIKTKSLSASTLAGAGMGGRPGRMAGSSGAAKSGSSVTLDAAATFATSGGSRSGGGSHGNKPKSDTMSRNSKTKWPYPHVSKDFLPVYDLKNTSEKDFKVTEVLASGAYGNFLKGYKVVDRKPIAMKVIDKARVLSEGPGAIQQCKDEVLIQSNLPQHPLIVELLAFWQTRNRLYLVMEFVCNGELFYLWKALRLLSEPLTRFYLAQISQAIEFLHNHDVVYRDIKMENLLLDARGHVKVIDFGLSKKLAARDKTYTICGTLQYTAPEMLRGEPYSHSVDWWSLGILAYALLLGKFPVYGAKNHYEMRAMVQQYHYRVPVQVSRDAADTIGLLLQKDLTKRIFSLESLQHSPFFREELSIASVTAQVDVSQFVSSEDVARFPKSSPLYPIFINTISRQQHNVARFPAPSSSSSLSSSSANQHNTNQPINGVIATTHASINTPAAEEVRVVERPDNQSQQPQQKSMCCTNTEPGSNRIWSKPTANQSAAQSSIAQPALPHFSSSSTSGGGAAAAVTSSTSTAQHIHHHQQYSNGSKQHDSSLANQITAQPQQTSNMIGRFSKKSQQLQHQQSAPSSSACSNTHSTHSSNIHNSSGNGGGVTVVGATRGGVGGGSIPTLPLPSKAQTGPLQSHTQPHTHTQQQFRNNAHWRDTSPTKRISLNLPASHLAHTHAYTHTQKHSPITVGGAPHTNSSNQHHQLHNQPYNQYQPQQRPLFVGSTNQLAALANHHKQLHQTPPPPPLPPHPHASQQHTQQHQPIAASHSMNFMLEEHHQQPHTQLQQSAPPPAQFSSTSSNYSQRSNVIDISTSGPEMDAPYSEQPTPPPPPPPHHHHTQQHRNHHHTQQHTKRNSPTPSYRSNSQRSNQISMSTSFTRRSQPQHHPPHHQPQKHHHHHNMNQYQHSNSHTSQRSGSSRNHQQHQSNAPLSAPPPPPPSHNYYPHHHAHAQYQHKSSAIAATANTNASSSVTSPHDAAAVNRKRPVYPRPTREVRS